MDRYQKKLLYVLVLAALIEGFTGLGIEIYVMRLAGSYVGNSNSITGVIIGIMLVAIALGYWWGGKISNKVDQKKRIMAAGLMLGIAAAIQAVAASAQGVLIFLLMYFKLDSLLSAALLSVNFAIGMVFATAAIPMMTQVMVDELNDEKQAGKYTGVMVASTTLGSVLGSVLTPIFLLPALGLQATISFLVILLMGASNFVLLSNTLYKPAIPGTKKPYFIAMLLTFLVAVLSLFNLTIKFDNSIQTRVTGWYIFDVDTKKSMDAVSKTIMTDAPNKLFSSCWQRETQTVCDAFYPKHFIKNILADQPRKLLMFGGAGLAIPSDHRVTDTIPNINITVVDIDGDLPHIVSEQYLKKPVGKHINFIPKDVRSYVLTHQKDRYDMIMVDVFRGKYVDGITFTLENLRALKAMSNKVIANVIGIPNPNNSYTQIIASTWLKAYGDNAHWILDEPNNPHIQGIVFCSYKCEGGQKISTSPYFKQTDNINTLDRVITDGYYQQQSI